MSKKIIKAQEFAAHAGKVNCLTIGRKSGRVMATGGEDKKINVWTIGKSVSQMSLEGHQSSVECVAFDNEELNIMGGSSGGTVKLWDCEQQKVARTINAHKAGCTTVDFHPFHRSLVASGSVDTSIRIWDVRRTKQSIQECNHSKGVTVLKFSPDGLWIVSGGEDGVIKLVDLKTGKVLKEFKHDGPIAGIEFHPNELLLAASTLAPDKKIKFFDLDTMESVSVVDPIDSINITVPYRPIAFHPSGNALFCAEADSLRVVGWEPGRSYDNVAVPWRSALDMYMTADQLLVASAVENMVSVWVTDIKKFKPFSNEESNYRAPTAPSFPVVEIKAPEVVTPTQKAPPKAQKENVTNNKKSESSTNVKTEGAVKNNQNQSSSYQLSSPFARDDPPVQVYVKEDSNNRLKESREQKEPFSRDEPVQVYVKEERNNRLKDSREQRQSISEPNRKWRF